jgi:3-oxoacyl-[acyl-carrier protein] reductase
MARTAIVTGGTKGLGREIALAFGQSGYSVLVLYSSDETAAERLRALFGELKIQGSVIRHDVTVEESMIWSRPEIENAESLTFIHNACTAFSPKPIHQLHWRDLEDNLRVAVRGGWLCVQGLIRPMLKKGSGVIVSVLTSAVEGQTPKGFAAYVTAKHALKGLTLALAAEFAERGVRVFSVSPGFMDTSLTERWDPRLREIIRAQSRITDPAQAAKRLVELVNDETATGQGEDYTI